MVSISRWDTWKKIFLEQIIFWIELRITNWHVNKTFRMSIGHFNMDRFVRTFRISIDNFKLDITFNKFGISCGKIWIAVEYWELISKIWKRIVWNAFCKFRFDFGTKKRFGFTCSQNVWPILAVLTCKTSWVRVWCLNNLLDGIWTNERVFVFFACRFVATCFRGWIKTCLVCFACKFVVFVGESKLNFKTTLREQF